jgi:hypothetical protein
LLSNERKIKFRKINEIIIPNIFLPINEGIVYLEFFEELGKSPDDFLRVELLFIVFFHSQILV